MHDTEPTSSNGSFLRHSDVLNALSTVELTFRNYRERLVAAAGNIAYVEKDDKSPVTDLDIEIENAVQSALKIKHPMIPVYGEETGYGIDSDAVFWLVDPIDGTKSFIQGLPTFSNMAVLIEHGTARAAVIYNPSRDEMYTAIKGHGTYKNNIRMDITFIASSDVVLCKNEFAGDIKTILDPFKMRPQIPPSGGGHGFTQILDGHAAARFQMHASGFAHDYAPGALLVSEAGGSIIPIKDAEYTFSSTSFVACHPILTDIIVENVPKLRALDS